MNFGETPVAACRYLVAFSLGGEESPLHHLPLVAELRLVQLGVQTTRRQQILVRALLDHSDTVVVTADGIEMMTYYPRDLESLTLPV